MDVANGLVKCGETSFELPQRPWNNDALRMFIDGSVIESFFGGREALTSRVYNVAPGETELEIELLKGDELEVRQWALKAISPDRLTT